jgi:hypothetical protein
MEHQVQHQEDILQVVAALAVVKREDRLEELVDQAAVDQVDLQVILVQLEQQTLEVVEVVVLVKVVLLMVQPAAKA